MNAVVAEADALLEMREATIALLAAEKAFRAAQQRAQLALTKYAEAVAPTEQTP